MFDGREGITLCLYNRNITGMALWGLGITLMFEPKSVCMCVCVRAFRHGCLKLKVMRHVADGKSDYFLIYSFRECILTLFIVKMIALKT